MKTQIFLLAAVICSLFVSCEYDNYEEPDAILSGRVVYEGNPVGVRSNANQLELWQNGFRLYTKIPVYIAHDGTFSAALKNGEYKLVRLAGAPWDAQSSDTILVKVSGKTEIDVPVTPFYTVTNETYEKGEGTITAKFTVQKIIETAGVHSVNLYFGKNILTDQNFKEGSASLTLANLKIGSENTLTGNIPASLLNNDYIFVRIGIRSSLSNEYFYTQVQKISLK